jgi:hypothetical protein
MVCPQKVCGFKGYTFGFTSFLDSAITALGVEQFSDEFEIHGVVVAEGSENGHSSGPRVVVSAVGRGSWNFWWVISW